MIKEFSLENNYIKCIKINDTFSRIIMGTSKGELKYFDIEHLKLDTSLNQKNDEKSKSKEDDPINEIYSFDNYPLCLAFHESANNIFEIIPPTYYKYRTFGKFKNIINKDNVERNVKITACEYDKESMILFTGDLFGYVHCYNLKDLIDNVKYLNHNESSKDDIQYLNNLENLKIEKIFSFEACREKIIHINYPDINPNIIIITGSDRRVKLFLSENGTYIDEFKQSSENAIIYPIGLKYYYSDPFISKINSEEELKYDFIYRKDITNFKMNKVTQEINNMKATHKPLYDYINSLIKLNAKERLYLMTKNADIPFDKSSSWKFEPNIEIINNKLRKLSNIDIKDKVIYEYNPIDSKNYYPKFINYMDPEKMKDFSDMVNNKIRKVQLNLAKIDLNNKKFNQYEKEHSNKMHYSYNKNRNFNILLDDTLKKKDFNTGKNSQKKDFIRNKFDRYKYDIDFRLKDLNNMFETKIFNRYNLLQDNKTSEKKYLLTSNNLLNRKKLPKINKEKRDNINQENKNNQ
jgi:hypothetical protein